MRAQAVAAPVAAADMPPAPHPSVVIDPELALSPLGLIVVARLSARCAVWVAPELREVLRSNHAYRDQPQRLLSRPQRVPGVRRHGSPGRADGVRSALVQWSTVLASRTSAVRTFYLGDRPGDSVVPSHVDPGVHERFEFLARGLDVVMMRSGYDLPRGLPIASCFRDAVALAAALAQERSFILTLLEGGERGGGGAPALCNYLEAWKIPVSDVTTRAEADTVALRSVLARAGLGPVEWSGVAFAALHVVPHGLAPESERASSRTRDAAAVRLWEQTRVFWHRL